jgi:Protein of unknown function (DUF1761)
MISVMGGSMMANANWLAILAATLAAFMVGGVWYGPLFSKPWMAELGLNKDSPGKRSMAMLLGFTLLLDLVSAFFLGHLLAHVAHSTQTILMISTGIALGFITPALCINYLYQGQSVKLMAIDCGHWIVVYAVMGGVFAVLGV